LTGEVKLADFGVSSHLISASKRFTVVGTPYWMAPEVVAGGSGYDLSADIWSLGITAIECAHGRVPRIHESPLQVLATLLRVPPPRLSQESGFSKYFHAFVTMCLRKKPRERASAERCLLFPFIKRAKRVSTLIPRIKSYTKWRRVNPLEDKQSQSGSGNLGTEIGTWDLDTISKVNSIKPTYTEDNLFALKCKLCNKRIPLEDLETHSSKCESVETRRTTATTTATTRNTSGRSTGPSLDSPKQILPKSSSKSPRSSPKSSTKGSPSTPKSASKKRMPKKHSPFSKSVDVLPSQVKSPAAQKRRRRRSSQYSKPRIAMHGNKKNDEKGSPSSTKELGATDAGGDLPLANGVIDIDTTMNKKKEKTSLW